MHRILYAGSFLLLSAVHAEHGGTAKLEEAKNERRSLYAGKVLNERLPGRWSDDGESLHFHLEIEPGKRVWKTVDVATGDVATGEISDHDQKPKAKAELTLLKKQSGPPPVTKIGAKSPDGQSVVKFADGKLILKQGEKETSLSYELDKGWSWENRILWAPDSSRFVAWKNTHHEIQEVHYVRSSPKDQVQPEHFSKRYPKPGANLNVAHPVVFFTDGREPIELDETLAQNPFDLRNPRWRSDSARFTLEFIERGFGSYRVIEIETEKGVQRRLIDESDEKFVFVFGNCERRDLSGGEEILWLSERDGWNHLFLYDGKTGEVIRQLTKGEWVVREITRVDEDARKAMLKVSGFHPDQDPYHIHYLSVDLDSGAITALTDGDGTHEIFLSPDQAHYVAKWSRIDHPPVFELRRASDGKKIKTLSKGTLDQLEKTTWVKPERFVAKDRNDEYDLHGIIFRPSDFDPKKKYPVVEAIYAGPHGSFTPKSWRITHGVMSEMAEAGFIVVKLDALGTNYRGKKFQQVAYKNLIDSGFPDRIKWIRAAAAKYPEMDLNRVGIYGGSAGAQSTLAALLTHPDFYRAGAADCGCHDNRMDKIWWNEQWMDWPIDESYESNSNVTHAAKLKGHLLLTVGEVDTNVDPSSTLQVVNALIKADKDFEFFLVPNGGHGVGESPYLRRQRIDFFKRHLGGPTSR